MKSINKKISVAVMGVIFITLGITLLRYPVETLLSLSWIIGIAALVSGLSTFIFWLKVRETSSSGFFIIAASVLQIALGISFLCSEAMAKILPILLAVWILIKSISIIARSTDYKKMGMKKWWVVCLFGVVLACLAASVFYDPIKNGGNLISIILGCGMILTGLVDLGTLIGLRIFEEKIGAAMAGNSQEQDNSIDEQ